MLTPATCESKTTRLFPDVDAPLQILRYEGPGFVNDIVVAKGADGHEFRIESNGTNPRPTIVGRVVELMKLYADTLKVYQDDLKTAARAFAERDQAIQERDDLQRKLADYEQRAAASQTPPKPAKGKGRADAPNQ